MLNYKKYYSRFDFFPLEGAIIDNEDGGVLRFQK
jgi:hypothetical protein